MPPVQRCKLVDKGSSKIKNVGYISERRIKFSFVMRKPPGNSETGNTAKPDQ